MAQKNLFIGKDRLGNYKDVFVDPTGRMGLSYNFRGTTTSASSTVTRNDRTEVMGAVTGFFTDLVTVIASNTSTNAISIDLRSGRDSGISASINAAASSNSVINFGIPLQANEAATPWVATASSVVADSGDSPVTLNLIAINTSDS